MRNKVIIISIFTLLVFNNLQAQNAQSYSRCGVSAIYIKHSGDNLSLFNYVNSIQIPDQFDHNYFGDNSLNVGFNMQSPAESELKRLRFRLNNLNEIKNKDRSTFAEIGEVNKQIRSAESNLIREKKERDAEILNKISENKIPNKILASILIEPGLGYMTTTEIAKRGMYNASDADYMTAMNSANKIDVIKDKGDSLLKYTYLFVFDIMNYSIIPNEKNNKLETYVINGKVHLIQIDIDSLMKNGEWDNLIFMEENRNKLDLFNKYNFPIKLLYSKDFSSSNMNYRYDIAGGAMDLVLKTNSNNNEKGNYIFLSDDEIQKGLLSNSIKDATDKFSKIFSPFMVKASIFESKPLSVKIGKKEGLAIDNLYKVTENKISTTGKVSERKIGWIRVKKVTNNKSDSKGNTQPSSFYKVASKRIERGMKVSAVNEKGFVIGVGYYLNVSNISKGITPSSTGTMDGPVIQVDYITHFVPGLRVGIEFGGFQKIVTKQVVYESGNTPTDYEFTGSNMVAGLLIQKIFQANRLEFTPYIGGYYSTLKFDKYSNDVLKTPIQIKDSYYDGLINTQYGIQGGAKLGFNFGRHFQFNIGYKYWKSLKDETKSDNESDITMDDYNGNRIKFQYSDPGAVSVGLRLFGF